MALISPSEELWRHLMASGCITDIRRAQMRKVDAKKKKSKIILEYRNT